MDNTEHSLVMLGKKWDTRFEQKFRSNIDTEQNLQNWKKTETDLETKRNIMDTRVGCEDNGLKRKLPKKRGKSGKSL